MPAFGATPSGEGPSGWSGVGSQAVEVDTDGDQHDQDGGGAEATPARTDPTGRLAAINRQPARPSAGPAGPAALAGEQESRGKLWIPSGHGQLSETVRFCDSLPPPPLRPGQVSTTRVRNQRRTTSAVTGFCDG